MRWLPTVLLVVAFNATQASAQRRPVSTPSATRDSVVRIMQELASAISRRDANDAARYIREDHHAVYVSDGYLIRGTSYRQTLKTFYQGLRRLRFVWDSLEIEPAGRNTWVVTSWAAIRAVDTAGQATDSRAVFTTVVSAAPRGWEIVAAHKTTVP